VKKVGLDTCFLNHCYDEGISGKRLAEAFRKQEYIPYVCPYVTYELARTFKTSSFKCKALFELLKELNPNFITRRDMLYTRELDKLKNGDDVTWVADEVLRQDFQKRIEGYIKGIPDIPENYINLKQQGLASLKVIWAPKGAKKILKHKFGGSFPRLIDNFFSLILDGDQYRIDYAKKIVLLVTEGNILLSNEEIVILIKKNLDYPVFNTLIRLYAYLDFLTQMNIAVPSEDRFTDGLIMIEYAYCDFIVSQDKNLVEKHARHINPGIKLIKAAEFIESLSIVPFSADAVT